MYPQDGDPEVRRLRLMSTDPFGTTGPTGPSGRTGSEPIDPLDPEAVEASTPAETGPKHGGLLGDPAVRDAVTSPEGGIKPIVWAGIVAALVLLIVLIIAILGAVGDDDDETPPARQPTVTPTVTATKTALASIDRTAVERTDYVDDYRKSWPALATGRKDADIADTGVSACAILAEPDVTRSGAIKRIGILISNDDKTATEDNAADVLQLAVRDVCSDRAAGYARVIGG